MIPKHELLPALQEKYIKKGVTPSEFNLFGIRFEENQQTDDYNDLIGFWTKDGVWVAQGTTDPGWIFTMNPYTVDGISGAAHLCYGFHRDAWMIGVHAPQHPQGHLAFVQWGAPVTIWRDVNKDGAYSPNLDAIQIGWFGINIHSTGKVRTEKIGPWSAGCQVFKNIEDLESTLAVAKSISYYRENHTRFSYFLFDKSEFNF